MLLILKVLFILLLAFVVLCLLALFYPIKYLASASRHNEDNEIHLKIHWLFGLLRVIYDYPERGTLLVKLGFFTVYDSNKEQKQKKDDKRNIKKSKNSKKENVNYALLDGNDGEKNGTKPNSNDEWKSKAEYDTKKQAEGNNDKIKNGYDFEHDEQDGIFERIIKKFDDLKFSLDKTNKQIVFYKGLWEEKDNQILLRECLDKILKVLIRVKPKVFKVNLLVGTGAPDTTGYLLAIYGMLLPSLSRLGDIELDGDFQQLMLEGNVLAKGRFALFTILLTGLSIILDQRVKKLQLRIKKHKLKMQRYVNES